MQHGSPWISSKPASLFRSLEDGRLGDELCSPFDLATGEGMKVRETVEVIPAHNGKHATKIVTAVGVVGLISSDVPLAAIQGLYQKLLLQQGILNQTMRSPSSVKPMRCKVP